MTERKMALVASSTEAAQAAATMLGKRYSFVPMEEADLIVALGGDGYLLHTLHEMLDRKRICPVFGMNRGTVGFLMNEWRLDGLHERVARAKPFTVRPMEMRTTSVEGEQISHHAINEVSLLRETRQTAWIEVSVNGRVVLPELICDGVLVATPAGSTAYNLSAQGPILPLSSKLVALTPISPFRPRRWRGALLPNSAYVVIEVVDPHKRPVAAVADHDEARDVVRVEVLSDKTISMRMLFDPGHSLEERILREQFGN